ncbi:PIN domain nuclease [Dactylosporangium sp. AC04546]|uniref:PIN domain nuclease n=1 Tax=Dactylosporangium sp. AC04546 TaxID=2862460 RepID=UPI001EE10F26|nr:PIN domain nuclease [Dactylosporangium sp. AC04546]WVK85568.1 PIN domain nuclease [Dactylosporangium sp. AC04546]
MEVSWLIDKSALVRLGASPDAETWADRIGRGLVHITTVTLLEVGYSARTAREIRTASSEPPLSLMPVEYLTPAMEQRAVEVQATLADLGQHRAPGIPDLLIAAAAERAGHTVLHLDKDFEVIAGATGQPTERLRT